jgi:hypothetical protein
LNRKATRATRSAISLSSSNHFAGHARLHDNETGSVATRAREARNEAVAERIGDEREDDGDAAAFAAARSHHGRAVRKNEIGLQHDRVGYRAAAFTTAPTRLGLPAAKPGPNVLSIASRASSRRLIMRIEIIRCPVGSHQQAQRRRGRVESRRRVPTNVNSRGAGLAAVSG